MKKCCLDSWRHKYYHLKHNDLKEQLRRRLMASSICCTAITPVMHWSRNEDRSSLKRTVGNVVLISEGSQWAEGSTCSPAEIMHTYRKINHISSCFSGCGHDVISFSEKKPNQVWHKHEFRSTKDQTGSPRSPAIPLYPPHVTFRWATTFELFIESGLMMARVVCEASLLHKARSTGPVRGQGADRTPAGWMMVSSSDATICCRLTGYIWFLLKMIQCPDVIM